MHGLEIRILPVSWLAKLLLLPIAVASVVLPESAPAAPATTESACRVSRCLSIEVFVLVPAGSRSAPVHGQRVPGSPPPPHRSSVPDREAWFRTQVRHANRLFAPLDIGFQVSVRRTVDGPARIRTRKQRDALGQHPRDPRSISVFLVGELDDVDIEGHMLRGVHWRKRTDRSQTWIILSALDDTGAVLAHELGHYFGLPHSRDPRSVMNKSPHDDPAFVDRVFTTADIATLRTGLGARAPRSVVYDAIRGGE